MNMTRRLDKLESALPENTLGYRLVFANGGEPEPPVPVAAPNERIMVVRFVKTAKSRAKRLLAAPLNR